MLVFHRLLVSAVALLFIGLGIWLMLYPREVEDLYPIVLQRPMAVSEMRAIFGGLMLGVGAAVVWLVWRVRRAIDGGVVLLFVFGGLLLARIAGIVGEGWPKNTVLTETVFEIVVFAMVLFTTLKIRDRA